MSTHSRNRNAGRNMHVHSHPPLLVVLAAMLLLSGPTLSAQLKSATSHRQRAAAATTTTGVDGKRAAEPRLEHIRAMLQRAPDELASSGEMLRPFGVASLDTSPALRGLSIALLDTSGARVALLFGNGVSVDAIPATVRKALAVAAVDRARVSQQGARDATITSHRAQGDAESPSLVLVMPAPRAEARCDCLLDADGALVAALSPSGSASFIDGDGMLEGVYLPLTKGARTPAAADRETPPARHGAREPAGDFGLIAPGFLALLVLGAMGGVAWKRSRAARESGMLPRELTRTYFDLNELVDAIAGGMSTSLAHTIKLETYFNIAPAMVRADRRRVAMLLRQLMKAAGHAMPDGGTLTIVTRFAEVTDDSAERLNVPIGHFIVLEVSGTEPRPQDDPAAATAPFMAASALGRSAIERIVASHGWSLRAGSAQGTGGGSSIYMPLASESVIALSELHEHRA